MDSELRRLLREWESSGGTCALAAAIGDLQYSYRHFTEARRWYRRALTFAPADAALRDRFEDAVLRGLEALLERDSPRQRLSLKRLHARCRIESLERRGKERPDDAGLHFELGKAFYILARTDEALRGFQLTLRDSRRRSMGHYFIAKCFFRLKRHSDALLHLAAMEELGLSGEMKVEVRYCRDQISREMGEA
jgi:tetratricopeptide (TPR) repeat protein